MNSVYQTSTEKVAGAGDKSKTQSIITTLLWVVTGVFALSAVGTLFLQGFGLPYVPEVFFLPLIVVYWNKIKKQISHIGRNIKPFFALVIFIEIVSILVGVVNTGYDFYGVFSCIRPLLYITLISSFFSKDASKCIPLMSIFWLCLGGQVGEILSKFFDTAYSSINSIDHINWLAVSVTIFVPAIKGKNKLLWISIIVGLISAILSFYRRIMLFYLLTILILVIFRIATIKSFKKTVYLCFIAIASYLILSNFDLILSHLLTFLKVDYSLFEHRFITKFSALFEGETTVSDQVRFNSYQRILDNFNNTIFPKGPVGKSVDIHSYFGLYTDTPLAFFIDVFGSYFSIVLLCLVAYRGLKSFINSIFFSKLYNQTSILCGLMFPLLLISIFDDGAFVLHLNYAWVTAYCISGWFFSKQKRRKGSIDE